MDWFIKVRDSIYGPYDPGRMQGFAREGRLNPHTLVGSHADGKFAPASEHPQFKAWFKPHEHETDTQPEVSVIAIHVFPGDDAGRHLGTALAGQGSLIHPLPGLWLLQTRCSVDSLRNRLSRNFDPGGSFILFRMNGQATAWFNIGQQADRQIREFMEGDR